MASNAPPVGRILETGSILGMLTVILAATGLFLSPTLGLGGGNAAYVAHMVAAVLLVAFIGWHLWPMTYSLLKKAGQKTWMRVMSFTLLGLLVVEIVTGYVLWAHDYSILPKAPTVFVHLGTTGLLVLPLLIHTIRGVSVWNKRRFARMTAVAAADGVGRGVQARDQRSAMSRRTFVRFVAYGTAGVALAVAFGRAASNQVKGWRLNSVGAIPNLTKENYRLKISGLVNNPVELSFTDLISMRARTQVITHHCVEGWTYTDTFTGVPLKDVLQRAGGVKSNGRMLVFKSPEVSRQPWAFGRKYTSSFPVQQRALDESLLVFEVAGEDLPAAHGYPVRLMTPTKWGYKACKWCVEIEVLEDASYRGYWEDGGYHPVGDYPGPIFG